MRHNATVVGIRQPRPSSRRRVQQCGLFVVGTQFGGCITVKVGRYRYADWRPARELLETLSVDDVVEVEFLDSPYFVRVIGANGQHPALSLAVNGHLPHLGKCGQTTPIANPIDGDLDLVDP